MPTHKHLADKSRTHTAVDFSSPGQIGFAVIPIMLLRHVGRIMLSCV